MRSQKQSCYTETKTFGEDAFGKHEQAPRKLVSSSNDFPISPYYHCYYYYCYYFGFALI